VKTIKSATKLMKKTLEKGELNEPKA
jgi:polyhydroxyalkanoate synthesis regulator phasin